MTNLTFANIIQDYGALAMSVLSLVISSAIALSVQASKRHSGFRDNASAWAKTMYEFGLGEHIGGLMVYRPRTFHFWRKRWYLTVYVVQEAGDATRCSNALLMMSGGKSRAEAVAMALHGNFKFAGEPTLDDIREHLEPRLPDSVEDMVIKYPLNERTLIHVESAKVNRLVALPAALKSCFRKQLRVGGRIMKRLIIRIRRKSK